MPTASAVLGDVIDAALNLSNKTYRGMEDLKEVSLLPSGEQKSAYYVSVQVVDEPAFWQLWLQYSQRVTYLFKQWNRKEWVEKHILYLSLMKLKR